MKIYNTLSGKKEEFLPIDGKNVKMYACGITVSGEAHIGHAFQALIYDIIRKYLSKRGYDVSYARNYTDVDDKIIAKANELGVNAEDYAKQMIEKIDQIMARFDVDDPDIWLKATENIQNIIDFISTLIEKGHAYKTADGSVYFSVQSFPSYGRLSHRNIDDMLDGVRIENDAEKLSALDFALWKSAKPGEIFWESPWGKGRPGWHIECSAMNMQAFGDEIDIHGGGRDLIFPHHENEIAQTEALTGKRFSKYWMHNGLIKVNGQKMSKSLGNFILLSELLDNFSPDAVKFALLSTSYRNDVNITDNLFSDSEKHVYEFYKVIAEVEARFGVGGSYAKIDEEFNSAMDDDFNTALAISNLFGYFKAIKKALSNGDESAKDMVAQIKKTYSLLGLFKVDAKKFTESYESKNKSDIPSEILALLEEMQNARKEKNWAVSDKIRDEILQKGYLVKITKDGCEVTKK